jgi:TonB family protein
VADHHILFDVDAGNKTNFLIRPHGGFLSVVRILAIIIIFATIGFVHAQNGGISSDRANKEALDLYQQGNFKKAAQFGATAFELAKKEFGTADRRTAVIGTNLGLILHAGRRYKEAVEAFRETLEIYERTPDAKGAELALAFDRLGDLQYSAGDETSAEATYLKAIEAFKAKFPSDFQSAITVNINAAKFYGLRKNYAKASEYFLTGFEIAYKNFGKDSRQLESVENAFACSARVGQVSKGNYKSYWDGVKRITGRDDDSGGIVNGKAKSLPKPAYPQEARAKRVGGGVTVRVMIDENGNVSDANAICGPPELMKASEEAAWIAKFSPTSLNGKTVKVTGFIFYYFVP